MDDYGWEFVGYGATHWRGYSVPQEWWIFRRPVQCRRSVSIYDADHTGTLTRFRSRLAHATQSGTKIRTEDYGPTVARRVQNEYRTRGSASICRLSTASLLMVIRAAPVALITFALLLPAKAQFWGDSWGGQQQRQRSYNPFGGFGDSWGGRQQQRQQPYNPYGGFGGDRQWDYWDYRQRERPSPRQREQHNERSRAEQPTDYSHAPPATPRKDAPVKIMVMGDANADWLAYGLEDAFSEKTEIGIVRKHRTDSGLIRYDQRRDSEWPQVAREIIAAEKPTFIVMMIGNNDRQSIREKAPPPRSAPQPKAQSAEVAPAGPLTPPDPERPEAVKQDPHSPEEARQAAHGPWEFQSEKWELAYIKRIDATIAALKSAGVPVIWVGLPSQRGTNASDDSSYLNELYRSQAEKAGIAYVDIWDGFVDEAGKFSPQGPDYLGQTRRLRTSDGVYFTKFGARKLALYVEREIERSLSQRVPVALPVPAEPEHRGTQSKPRGSIRPVAGPVVPLTGANVGSERVLLGGAAESRGASDGLSAGEGVGAPTGRADDFTWPRGDITTEGAAVRLSK
jgi:hypothetical protein